MGNRTPFSEIIIYDAVISDDGLVLMTMAKSQKEKYLAMNGLNCPCPRSEGTAWKSSPCHWMEPVARKRKGTDVYKQNSNNADSALCGNSGLDRTNSLQPSGMIILQITNSARSDTTLSRNKILLTALLFSTWTHKLYMSWLLAG